MSYSDDETIVCEFLRKISPSREWEYLGEIEHCWIGELCDAIREHESKENAKLRELCADLYAEMIAYSDAPHYNASVWAPKLRELGVEVSDA